MADARRKTVQVDTASKTGANVTTQATAVLPVTVASNPNRCLVLCYGDSGGGKSISSATYGGKNFTLAIRSDSYDGSTGEVWYLANPDVGTANISITFGATTTDRAYIGAICLYDVDVTDPVDITAKTTNVGSSISCSFTPNENNCVAVDAMYSNSLNDAGVADAGQVEIFKRSAGRSGGCSYETDIDATSEAMGWSSFSSSSSGTSMGLAVFQGAIPTGGGFLYNML